MIDLSFDIVSYQWHTFCGLYEANVSLQRIELLAPRIFLTI